MLRQELRILLVKHQNRLSDALSPSKRDDRINGVTNAVKSALLESSLCLSDGILSYYANGVYVGVRTAEVENILYNLLCELGVPSIEANRVVPLALPVVMDRHKESNPQLIAFRNCVYDLSCGGVYDFDKSLMTTYRVGYDYDAMATAPVWESFLEQVLPCSEDHLCLQEFVGMIYVDRQKISIEKCLLMIGEGANGKSVVYNVISSLVGREYISTLTPTQLRDSKQLTALRGMKLNYCSEVKPQDAFSASLKALVSGEKVAAWDLYRGVSEIIAPPIIFTMNRYPQTEDMSHGFFRRILPLRFGVTIPPSRQDKTLASRIIDTELSGIFNWAIEGRARLLRQRGEFTQNPYKDAEIETIRTISAPAVRYMEDNGYMPSPQCKGQQPTFIRVSDLCEILGLNPRILARQLEGFRQVRKDTRCYVCYSKNNIS